MSDIREEIKQFIKEKAGENLPITIDRFRASLDPSNKNVSLNQIVIADVPDSTPTKANQLYTRIAIACKHKDETQARKFCKDTQDTITSKGGGRLIENGTIFARIILRQNVKFVGSSPKDDTKVYESQIEFIYKDDNIYPN